MKIALINPGVMDINPDKWGAIEKILFNYKKYLEKNGHTVDIVSNFNANFKEYDIVHNHMSNYNTSEGSKSADQLTGVPTIFSEHDHHVLIRREVSKNHVGVINDSIKTIVHGKNIMEHFSDKVRADKLEFLSHGVDTEIYKNKNLERNGLLVLASNGIIGQPLNDRKGFIPAVEFAQKMNLPITFAGPESNRQFFEHYDIFKYKNAKFIYNPTEEGIINLYNTHHIFLHLSNLEAGQPNLTLLESLACGLPIIGTYDGYDKLDGMVEVNEINLHHIAAAYNSVMLDYKEHQRYAVDTANIYSWRNIVKKLEKIYIKSMEKPIDVPTSVSPMKDAIINLYNSTSICNRKTKEYTIDFKNNPTVNTVLDKPYKINFVDKKNNKTIYSTEIGGAMWTRPSIQYFIDWDVQVNGKSNPLELENKEVLITFGSSALGDSIAWIPYVEVFQQKHKCKITVATFHNDLFITEYPELTFVTPGVTHSKFYAHYEIGCYDNDTNKNKQKWNGIPLQMVATDILGLEYKPIRAKINTDKKSENLPKKYIAITTNATAKAKLWNFPNAWKQLVQKINDEFPDYSVVMIGKDNIKLDGVIDKSGDNLDSVISILKEAKFFIGLPSGLAWLSNAIGTDTVMISGFSAPYTEFEPTIRIQNMNVCNSCYNKFDFDRGDWNWCPNNKDFICTSSITPESVFEQIKPLFTDTPIPPSTPKFKGDVNYNEAENKITVKNTGLENIIGTVLIRDPKTQISLYSFGVNIPPQHSAWAIPEIGNRDKYKKYAGGYIIDLELDKTITNRNYIFFSNENFKIPIPVKYDVPIGNDFHHLNEFYISGLYDSFLKDRKIETVVDIGANIGTFSYFMLDQGASKIHAVDCNSDAIKQLGILYNTNNKVSVYDIALSDKKKTLEFYHNPNQTDISSTDKHHTEKFVGGNNVKTAYVDAITLEDFLVQNNIEHVDVLKMDIEGSEYDVFATIEDKTLEKIDSWILEYHDTSNRNLELILDKLEPFYNVDVLDKQSQPTDVPGMDGNIFAERKLNI